jgi:hypothetical protein
MGTAAIKRITCFVSQFLAPPRGLLLDKILYSPNLQFHIEVIIFFFLKDLQNIKSPKLIKNIKKTKKLKAYQMQNKGFNYTIFGTHHHT